MSEKQPYFDAYEPEPVPPSYDEVVQKDSREETSDVLLHLFLITSFIRSLSIDPTSRLTEIDDFTVAAPPEPEAQWVQNVKSWISSFLPAETPAETDQSKHKKLQWRLTLAARNFVLFVSALAAEFAAAKDPDAVLDSLYPPIDVLFCWYSLLQRPRIFLHEFRAGGFESFAERSFPLHRISRCINKKTFIYEPSEAQKKTYSDFMAQKLRPHGIPTGVSYAVPQDPPKLQVFCPCCGEFLANVDLTNKDHTGFADRDFKANTKGCRCGFTNVVNHNSLQVRQLYKDAVRTEETNFIGSFHPNLTKLYFNYDNTDSIKALATLRHLAGTSTFKDLASHQAVSGMFHGLDARATLIARDYSGFNLVHATIPQKFAFPIHNDLVAIMFHSLNAILTINKFQIYKSPHMWPTIHQAEAKFEKFLRLHGDNKAPLVPSIDIDLIWRTRRIDMPQYFRECFAKAGKLLNYDTIDSSRLYREYNRTATLYRKKYKEKFTSCECELCTAAIKPSFSFFKSTKVVRSYLHIGRTWFDHLSEFDQVTVHREAKRSLRMQNMTLWALKEKFTDNFAFPFISLRNIKESDFVGQASPEDDWRAAMVKDKK